MSFHQIIDPSSPGRSMHKPINAIEKSNVFRSYIANLLKCLIIHRLLGSTEDFEVTCARSRDTLRNI